MGELDVAKLEDLVSRAEEKLNEDPTHWLGMQALRDEFLLMAPNTCESNEIEMDVNAKMSTWIATHRKPESQPRIDLKVALDKLAKVYREVLMIVDTFQKLKDEVDHCEDEKK